MAGSQFCWLAVFEQFRPVLVGQPSPETDEVFLDPVKPVDVVQMVAEKWSRTGTVNVSPGQKTEDVIRDIVKGSKADGVPEDAFLVDITILPNRLAG